jgi:ribosomal protein S6
MAKEDMMRENDSLEEVGDEPRIYELGFHLDPELPSEEVKKAYQAVRERVTGSGALVAEGEPMKIKLAYTISRQETAGRRDFDSAYFGWIVYETSATKHAEVIAATNEDKRIIRFIDLLTTKDAARHAVEMHEISMKTPEQRTEDAEETVNTAIDAALENVVV